MDIARVQITLLRDPVAGWIAGARVDGCGLRGPEHDAVSGAVNVLIGALNEASAESARQEPEDDHGIGIS